MNYPQTLEYLFSRLPMFHRIGAAAYKADLNNITALSQLLNHPEKKIKTIHVAGTNGKGSVSNMLASVLQEAGYKTGLFTSPHLKDFRERIRINGKMIPEETVTGFVDEFKHSFEDIKPSFFEWTTALAFFYFEKEKVDVAVIETGLGGRLDSTNIIVPELSVITNISFDHMQLLGDTIEKIAAEKAGIIKKNIPVIVGERQNECATVFIIRAADMNSPLIFASDNYEADFISLTEEGQNFRIKKGGRIIYENLTVELKGNYQQKNICTILQSLESLAIIFPEIKEDAIVRGLKNIFKNTGLQGRWQVIGKNPLTIADVGHNEAGIMFVTEQLRWMLVESNPDSYRDKSQKSKETATDLNHTNNSEEIKPLNRLHIVFGMVNDKNPSAVLSLLPKYAEYYFCKADIPRALDEDELKMTASTFNLRGESYSSVTEALDSARKKASVNDLIFVGGSTFVVAEVV